MSFIAKQVFTHAYLSDSGDDVGGSDDVSGDRGDGGKDKGIPPSDVSYVGTDGDDGSDVGGSGDGDSDSDGGGDSDGGDDRKDGCDDDGSDVVAGGSDGGGNDGCNDYGGYGDNSSDDDGSHVSDDDDDYNNDFIG